MADRKTYVYRLIVTCPPGSLEPGWQPPGWDPEIAHTGYIGPEEDEFRWPRSRVFLSASGARYAAGLFRKYGAEVTIERSAPVAWPQAVATAGEEVGR